MNLNPLLKELLDADDSEVFAIIRREIAADPRAEGDDYLWYEGDIPVGLVAHTDTVRRGGVSLVVSPYGIVRNAEGILGADDRAGVFGLIQLWQMSMLGKKPHLFFCDKEECGAVGANSLTRAVPQMPGIRLLIELDRRGSREYVHYHDALPQAIAEYVTDYGYVQSYGSFSDIDVLGEDWGIPAVNLSIGYYNQHQSGEYLVVPEMMWTIHQVFKMLQAPPKELHLPTRKYKSVTTLYGKDSTYDQWGMGSYSDSPWEYQDRLSPMDLRCEWYCDQVFEAAFGSLPDEARCPICFDRALDCRCGGAAKELYDYFHGEGEEEIAYLMEKYLDKKSRLWDDMFDRFVEEGEYVR